MIVAGYAIQATRAYLLRGPNTFGGRPLKCCIEQAKAAGYLPGNNILGSGWSMDLYVPYRRRPLYICGEETALFNSLEGRRANHAPNHRSPKLLGHGVNNDCEQR